jgi:hypothetical protein
MANKRGIWSEMAKRLPDPVQHAQHEANFT